MNRQVTDRHCRQRGGRWRRRHAEKCIADVATRVNCIYLQKQHDVHSDTAGSRSDPGGLCASHARWHDLTAQHALPPGPECPQPPSLDAGRRSIPVREQPHWTLIRRGTSPGRRDSVPKLPCGSYGSQSHAAQLKQHSVCKPVPSTHQTHPSESPRDQVTLPSQQGPGQGASGQRPSRAAQGRGQSADIRVIKPVRRAERGLCGRWSSPQTVRRHRPENQRWAEAPATLAESRVPGSPQGPPR